MAQYTVGQQVRISYEIRNSALALVDATLAHKIKAPDGTITTPATTSDGTGLKHYDLTLSAAGVWWARLETTGALVEAVEIAIGVNESQF